MWGSVAALISVCDQLVLKALTTLQVHIFISSFTIIQHILFIYFCCLVLCETCHCLGSFSIMSFHIFIVVFLMCLLIFVYSFIVILEHFMSERTTEKEKKQVLQNVFLSQSSWRTRGKKQVLPKCVS